jgi:phospholipid/cholesterol/gamma-HCH transport system substrate-binding protein
MARRDNALAVTAPLIKTIIFAVFGFVILAILWIQFGQIRFTGQKSYTAMFTTASGMRPAAPVMASGVSVGRVDDVEVVNNDQAKITFTMDASVPITQGTLARMRYKNLTGDQYLDLTPGPGSREPLADGGTIPIEQTTPSLDIDALLNGFNPLLQGLQPQQVNQLSAELVTVLQGQGGTINQVLQHAASFSGSLAEQDKVIGSVITNLNTVLGNLDAHSQDLSETFRSLTDLIEKLNGDRKPLIDGLDRTEDLAHQVGNIAKALRSGHDTFHELGRAAGNIADSGQELDRVLRLAPGAYLRLGRLSVEQGGYQLMFCSVRLRLTGPDGQPFYSPQVGPSDNSPGCSRNNVQPLQGGSASDTAWGPPVEQARWDGQQVVAGTRGQDDFQTNFTPQHGAASGNGR